MCLYISISLTAKRTDMVNLYNVVSQVQGMFITIFKVSTNNLPRKIATLKNGTPTNLLKDKRPKGTSPPPPKKKCRKNKYSVFHTKHFAKQRAITKEVKSCSYH